MAGNIKGITIEFRGETTELEQALKKVRQSTKDIDSELKAVNKALKFNPTNVDLWRQKQQLLTQKIDETSANLKELQAAQKKLDADKVDKNSAEYRELQREIIETESKLKLFNKQLREVGNVKLRALSEQIKQVGTKLERAGQSMREFSMAGAAVVATLGTLSYKSGQWADDLNTMSARYGIGTEQLQKYSAAAQLVDVDVETIASTHRRLTKAMSGSEDETGAQAEAFAKLGIETKNADGSLRDADAVWNETIKALGKMENETERDAIAMELMGKSATDLNTLIEDGGETYKMVSETFAKYGLDVVDQETLDRANEFNNQLDILKSMGLVAIQSVGAELAGYLAPALAKVVDLVGRIAGWLAQLDPRILTIIGVIGGFIAVLAPLTIGLGKLAFAISSIMSLMATLGPAIGGIVTALGPVVLAIGAVIAAGVLLYKNWDTIKAWATKLATHVKTTFTNLKNTVVTIWNKIKTTISNAVDTAKNKVVNAFNTIKNFISTVASAIASIALSKFNAVKDAIVNPINKAKELIQNAWNAIKRILSGNISLPHIKLPHFNITGNFSLNPPSVPHFSIDWYKTGGIFDSPSVIGVGEAGSEAVVPLDKFWDKLDKMQGGQNIVININGANADPKEIANEVKKVLIRETKSQRLAWQ